MQQSPASWRRVIAAVACLVVVMLARIGRTRQGAKYPPRRHTPQCPSVRKFLCRMECQVVAVGASLARRTEPIFRRGRLLRQRRRRAERASVVPNSVSSTSQGIRERDCTVPAGKALFFPLINVECSTLEAGTPFYGGNEAELRACLDPFDLGSAFVEIDGVRVENLPGYASESPLFPFTVPADNVLGVAPGAGESLAKGYYVMLHPLAVGNHTIRYGGALTSPYGGFALDITYNLTVGN